MTLVNNKKLENGFLLKYKRIVALLVFLLQLILCLYFVYQRYQLTKQERKIAVGKDLYIAEQKLYDVLNIAQGTCQILALSVNDKGVSNNFEITAKKLMDENPIIESVQLVKDSILRYFYPIKGNELELGKNIYKDAPFTRQEIQQGLKRNYAYFHGPLKLRSGGEGIVGLLPIYHNNVLWGYSSVVIKLDKLLETIGVLPQPNDYYQFQLSKINLQDDKANEEFFLGGDTTFSNKISAKRYIDRGDWNLYLKDTRSIYKDNPLLFFLIFGIGLSLLVSYLFYRFLDNQSKITNLLAQQHQLLIKSESKYKLIFDKAAIGILRVDSSTGILLEVNSFFCKILGYTEEELKQKKVKDLIYFEDLGKDSEYFKKLLKDHIKQYNSVRRFVHKDGHLIWVNSTVSPLWTIEQDSRQHIIIAEDITGQVLLENNLRHSKDHIENLINSLEGVVWEADMTDQYRCTFISNKISDLLGYTAEETIGVFNFMKIHPDDVERLMTYYKDELLKSKNHVLEYRLLSKNNEVKWVRDNVTIYPNLEEPKLLRGVLTDITQVKEAELDLIKSHQILVEQNKRLINFSYIVSHNLRSHSSNMQGLLTLIQMADTAEERQSMFAMLQTILNSLDATLINLNEIVNIRANIGVEKEKLNLHRHISMVIDTEAPRIASSNAQVINQVPVDIYVTFNKVYLESVLLNLLTNALKYASPDRAAVIVLDAEKRKDEIVFSIADNGLGIDLLRFGAKIFGLSQTFHGNADARGLGLFIVRSQIEAMGGSIEVQSTPGLGTTFYVHFKD